MKKIKTITLELLKEVSEKAKKSPRKRMNHNFHESYDDPINRMLNALEPGTYCRPHKHENPDKDEVFMVIKGKMAVLIFDDEGNITQVIKLIPKQGSYGVDIPPRIWHTLVSLEEGSVAYEVKTGPYEPLDDKNFAPWAPEEGSVEAPAYLQSLLSQI